MFVARSFRHFMIAWGLVVLLQASILVIPAQAQVSESVVKAAFLFNFAKFAMWPEEKFKGGKDSFVMCIQDGALTDEALSQFRDKSVDGRRIELIEISEQSGLERCHLAYISSGLPENEIKEIIAQGVRHSVLTVSDLDQFAPAGGLIGLVTREGKIRFEVNVRAAERSSIEFSSKLLSLAKII